MVLSEARGIVRWAKETRAATPEAKPASGLAADRMKPSVACVLLLAVGCGDSQEMPGAIPNRASDRGAPSTGRGWPGHPHDFSRPATGALNVFEAVVLASCEDAGNGDS